MSIVWRGRLPITSLWTFSTLNSLILHTLRRPITMRAISEEMSTSKWPAIKVRCYRWVVFYWKCLVIWGFAQDRKYPTRSWMGNLAGISPEQRHSLKLCFSKAVYYCIIALFGSYVKEASCAPESSVPYRTHSVVKYSISDFYSIAYAAHESREWGYIRLEVVTLNSELLTSKERLLSLNLLLVILHPLQYFAEFLKR